MSKRLLKVKTRKPKAKKAKKVRPVPNHIAEFFAGYPQFPWNRDASFIEEFYRMCDFFQWDRHSEEKADARERMSVAMAHQFNDTLGTNPDDLATWQDLCRVIRISPVPDQMKACRRAVNRSHVNICDLLDAPFLGKPPQRFPSEYRLAEYTRATGKVFYRDQVANGGLLEYLLRRIYNPPPDKQ
ncbi:hypothetical protein C8Q76DRAFT_794312 [Earliella scabrosa]|nr:hypothetical protein C8Q76DRAFT_794312 [Earliella scabrosa]